MLECCKKKKRKIFLNEIMAGENLHTVSHLIFSVDFLCYTDVCLFFCWIVNELFPFNTLWRTLYISVYIKLFQLCGGVLKFRCGSWLSHLYSERFHLDSNWWLEESPACLICPSQSYVSPSHLLDLNIIFTFPFKHYLPCNVKKHSNTTS